MPGKGAMFPAPSRERRGVPEGFTKLEVTWEGWDDPWQVAREGKKGNLLAGID